MQRVFVIYYSYGYFNIINMFFSGGGVKNNIVHQLVYGLVKLYVHEDSMYYHATYEIYFYNTFKYLLNSLSIRVEMC